MHAASLDTRIESTLVSGYFQPREEVWKEPIYRDVWGLLEEFGDAELAAMIAPRKLIVEASRAPEIAGPPASTSERKGAAPVGAIVTPSLESVRKEVSKARPAFASLKVENNLQLVPSNDGQGLPGSWEALTALLRSIGSRTQPATQRFRSTARRAPRLRSSSATPPAVRSARRAHPGRYPQVRPKAHGILVASRFFVHR